MGLATATATTVLSGSGQAAGLLDHTELIIALGLDHRGSVHQEIVATHLVGGHATTLGKSGVQVGESRALGTTLLLLATVCAASLTTVSAVRLAAVTTGHLLLWVENSYAVSGIDTGSPGLVLMTTGRPLR